MITRGKIIVKPGSCKLLWPENAAAAEHVAAKETLLFSRYITVCVFELFFFKSMYGIF